MSSWVSPTSTTDLGNAWTDDNNIYDGNTATRAYTTSAVIGTNWSDYLQANIAAIYCNKIQFYATSTPGGIEQIDIDVYYEGGWHDVYQGTYTSLTWVEKTITGGITPSVTAARIRFYATTDDTPSFWEFQFWSLTFPALSHGVVIF